MKGKFYKTIIRPVMMYGSVYWAINKKKKITMKVAEMRMLKLMCNLSKLNSTWNEFIRENLGVTNIPKKIDENRLGRRDNDDSFKMLKKEIIKKMGKIRVEENWERGKLKKCMKMYLRIGRGTMRDISSQWYLYEIKKEDVCCIKQIVLSYFILLINNW